MKILKKLGLLLLGLVTWVPISIFTNLCLAVKRIALGAPLRVIVACAALINDTQPWWLKPFAIFGLLILAPILLAIYYTEIAITTIYRIFFNDPWVLFRNVSNVVDTGNITVDKVFALLIKNSVNWFLKELFKPLIEPTTKSTIENDKQADANAVAENLNLKKKEKKHSTDNKPLTPSFSAKKEETNVPPPAEQNPETKNKMSGNSNRES